MQGLNRIFLMGRLGDTPYVYTAKNGKPFTGLSLATQRYKSQPEEGAPPETTDWHYVRVWGPQAELCAKYLSKGQTVLVEGYLSNYTQNKENGATEKKTSINAIRVDFLPHVPQPQESN